MSVRTKRWPVMIAAGLAILTCITVAPPDAGAADPTVTVWQLDRGVEDPQALEAMDGGLWFAGTSDTVARMDRVTSAYGPALDLVGLDRPSDLIEGPDGNLWITGRDNDTLGRLDPVTGAFDTFPLPGVDAPQTVATGPDGKLWVTGSESDTLGRFDPDTETLDVFGLPGVDRPWGVAAGPDDKVWVSGRDNDTLAEVEPSTGVVETVVPTVGVDQPRGLVGAPNGTVWVTGFGNNTVGRVVTATDTFNGFPFPVFDGSAAGPYTIITGSGGDLIALSGHPSRLATVDPDTGAVTTFLERNHLWADIALDEDGELWAGGPDPGIRGHVARVSPLRRYSTAGMLGPGQLAFGVDGNLRIGASTVGSFDPVDGTLDHQLPTVDEMTGGPRGVSTETTPDGNLWVTAPRDANRNQLYEIDHSLNVVERDSTSTSWNGEIAEGPDGRLWRWNTGSSVVGYPTEGGLERVVNVPSNRESGITAGPDGYLWVTSPQTDQVSRIDLDTEPATVDTFATGDVDRPRGATTGPDGRVWIVGGNGRVGRVNPISGTVTSYALDGFDTSTNVTPDFPLGIVPGPDGNVWVAGSESDNLGWVDPSDGSTGTIALPGLEGPSDVILGPDGNLWVSGYDNETVARVELGTPAPTGISGTVFESGSGQGVANAAVAVVSLVDYSAVAGVVANPDGGFLAEVPPGQYLLYLISSDGNHVSGFHGSPLPSTVTVDDDEITVVAPSMAPTAGTIAGTVTQDGTGTPLQGIATLSLSLATSAPERAASTGADGTYTLAGLAPGAHLQVLFDPTGAHRPEFFDDAAGPNTATTHTIAPGSVSNGDADLTPVTPPGTGASLTGTVTDTTSGQPLAGVWAVALRAADYSFARAEMTSNDGTYDLPLDPGGYKLEFIDPTWRHAMEWHHDHPYTAIGAADTITAPAVVDADLAPTTGSISGTVTDDPTGDPIAGVWVIALTAAGHIAGGAVTAPDGTYTIDALPPAAYRVTFADPNHGHTQQYWDDKPDYPTSDPITIAPGTTTTADAALTTT